MEFPVGIRVRIKNLKSRPDLNGTIAVVLAPSPQELTQLQSLGRVKITGGLKAISVKRENLTIIDEATAPKTDWSLLDGPEKETSDVLNIIRQIEDLGKIMRCTEFVEKLVDYINHDGVLIPQQQLDTSNPYLRDLLLNNITSHSIYIFRCDQIGHHFVLEVQEGKARLFQSFFHSVRQSSHRLQGNDYTAREWIHPTPHSDWEEGLQRVHQHYGGGKELSYLQFVEIIDLLQEIQRLAEVIANHYRSILPQWLVEAEDHWEKALQPEMPSRSPIGEWYDYCFNHAWMVTIMTFSNEEVMVQSNRDYDRQPFSLRFPPGLAKPFTMAVQRLHGKEPSSITYLMLFGFRLWRTVMHYDQNSKSAVPFGWSYSAITIPH